MFARLLEMYPHPEGGKWTGPRMQEATGGFVNAAYFSNLLAGRIKQPGLDKLKVIAETMGFPPQLWLEAPDRWGRLGGEPEDSPTGTALKDLLNNLKRREAYRPVAPICLEERAPDVFDPGTRDPFMIFEHLVRPEWRERVPAIVHHDGSARLQTIAETDKDAAAVLLREYHNLSGIPLLCNTSANFNGCGFFPDAASAMRWGGVPSVWSGEQLFEQV